MLLETDRLLDKANELKAAGRPFALVTVVRCVSPTSAKPGAKAVVTADGEIHGWIGGGCAQPAVIKTAKKAIVDGEARLIRISPSKGGEVEEGIVDFGMTCHSGGTLDIFIDPVVPRPAMLVIGGSPAAQSLVGLAQRVGYSVTAAYPGADRELFPEAEHLIDGLDMSALKMRPSFVVVATQGKRDEEGLEAALATPAPYVAFIASARKADKLRAYLKERGHEPARVDAIIAPAGVEIGAVTPEEIALSVLGGVVQARRNGAAVGTDAAVSLPKGDAKPAVSSCCGGGGAGDKGEGEGEGEAIDPICGMSVNIATAEHVSEYQGVRYYFCCAGCKHAFEKEPQKYLEATGA